MTPTQARLKQERQERLMRMGAVPQKPQPSKPEIVPADSIEPTAEASNVIDFDLERRIRQAAQVSQNLQVVYQFEKPVVLVEDIIAETAKFYNLTVPQLMAHRRTTDVLMPRHVAMYLAWTLTGKSLHQISRRFEYGDHTSVRYAHMKIASLMEKDERLRDEVQVLTMRLMDRFREPAKKTTTYIPHARGRARTWTDEQNAKVREMWAAGKTGGQIATVMGTTKNAVCARVRRLGLPRRRLHSVGPARRLPMTSPPHGAES